jgi:hypothetical protein
MEEEVAVIAHPATAVAEVTVAVEVEEVFMEAVEEAVFTAGVAVLAEDIAAVGRIPAAVEAPTAVVAGMRTGNSHS